MAFRTSFCSCYGWYFVWWTVPLVASVVADQVLIDRMIQWVVSAPHGMWNEKLEIRPADSGNYMGVFAKADIEPNETLLQIPRERYIHIMDVALEADYEESFDNHHANVCMLAKKLQQELASSYELTSAYAPYLAYLKQQTPGQLPVAWSDAGKNRLRHILPECNRNVVDWIDMDYEFCYKDGVDKDILALTIQRGFDVALIPLWDMVNHDNGKVNVGTTSWHDADGIRVWASQPIRAGQEVYATYDLCKDCTDVFEYWGTTEMLRDFGFVESYPQRWTWEDERVWFELHKDEDGVLSVRWDDHNGKVSGEKSRYYGPSQGRGLDFMKRELNRLQQLQLEDECNAPPHECQFIQQYHEALVTALSVAIAAAEAPSSSSLLA